MSPDAQKSFLVRLVLLSALAIAARYFLTMPRIAQTAELARAQSAQERRVSDGRASIDRFGSGLERKLAELDRFRDDLFERFPRQESTHAHNYLQSAAARRDLVVSRVEPLGRSIDRGASGGVADAVEIEETEFRIECRGRFADIVGFVSDLETAWRQAAVGNFHLVPTGPDEARIVMLVRMHQLIKVPEAMRPAETNATDSGDTGGSDGDE